MVKKVFFLQQKENIFFPAHKNVINSFDLLVCTQKQNGSSANTKLYKYLGEHNGLLFFKNTETGGVTAHGTIGIYGGIKQDLSQHNNSLEKSHIGYVSHSAVRQFFDVNDHEAVAVVGSSRFNFYEEHKSVRECDNYSEYFTDIKSPMREIHNNQGQKVITELQKFELNDIEQICLQAKQDCIPIASSQLDLRRMRLNVPEKLGFISEIFTNGPIYHINQNNSIASRWINNSVCQQKVVSISVLIPDLLKTNAKQYGVFCIGHSRLKNSAPFAYNFYDRSMQHALLQLQNVVANNLFIAHQFQQNGHMPDINIPEIQIEFGLDSFIIPELKNPTLEAINNYSSKVIPQAFSRISKVPFIKTGKEENMIELAKNIAVGNLSHRGKSPLLTITSKKSYTIPDNALLL